MAEDVITYLYMIPRDKLWDREKPYLLTLDQPVSIPKTNISMERNDGIKVADIRDRLGDFNMKQDGFALMNLDVDMSPDEFDNEEKIEKYFLPPAAESLKEFLGASRVQVFDFLVRRSHKSFPISTGEPYDHQQPSTILHIDTTPAWTRQQVQNLNPSSWKEMSAKRFQFVNVWKPLRGPVKRWPLCLCSSQTVDPASDLQARDLVLSNTVVESYQVHYSKRHRFYYVRDQTPSEAWVFLQSDSSGQTGTPHSSFSNPLENDTDCGRESIELRALVFYD